MILRRRVRPTVVLRVGMVSLVIASVLNWWVQRHLHNQASAWVDGAMGFAYGLAIGTMLLAIWMGRRKSDG